MILDKYFEKHEAQSIVASHTWVISKLDRQMIKFDDPFVHNSAVWKLGATYNRAKDPTAALNINLNMVYNPFQDKKARFYFKKNEFFLQSNYQNLSEQHAIELFAESEDKDEAEKQKLAALKEHIENILKLHSQHSFLSFVSSVRVNDERFQPPCIATLIVANKSPAVISKIKHFMIEDYIENQ